MIEEQTIDQQASEEQQALQSEVLQEAPQTEAPKTTNDFLTFDEKIATTTGVFDKARTILEYDSLVASPQVLTRNINTSLRERDAAMRKAGITPAATFNSRKMYSSNDIKAIDDQIIDNELDFLTYEQIIDDYKHQVVALQTKLINSKSLLSDVTAGAMAGLIEVSLGNANNTFRYIDIAASLAGGAAAVVAGPVIGAGVAGATYSALTTASENEALKILGLPTSDVLTATTEGAAVASTTAVTGIFASKLISSYRRANRAKRNFYESNALDVPLEITSPPAPVDLKPKLLDRASKDSEIANALYERALSPSPDSFESPTKISTEIINEINTAQQPLSIDTLATDYIQEIYGKFLEDKFKKRNDIEDNLEFFIKTIERDATEITRIILDDRLQKIDFSNIKDAAKNIRGIQINFDTIDDPVISKILNNISSALKNAVEKNYLELENGISNLRKIDIENAKYDLEKSLKDFQKSLAKPEKSLLKIEREFIRKKKEIEKNYKIKEAKIIKSGGAKQTLKQIANNNKQALKDLLRKKREDIKDVKALQSANMKAISKKRAELQKAFSKKREEIKNNNYFSVEEIKNKLLGRGLQEDILKESTKLKIEKKLKEPPTLKTLIGEVAANQRNLWSLDPEEYSRLASNEFKNKLDKFYKNNLLAYNENTYKWLLDEVDPNITIGEFFGKSAGKKYINLFMSGLNSIEHKIGTYITIEQINTKVGRFIESDPNKARRLFEVANAYNDLIRAKNVQLQIEGLGSIMTEGNAVSLFKSYRNNETWISGTMHTIVDKAYYDIIDSLVYKTKDKIWLPEFSEIDSIEFAEAIYGENVEHDVMNKVGEKFRNSLEPAIRKMYSKAGILIPKLNNYIPLMNDGNIIASTSVDTYVQDVINLLDLKQFDNDEQRAEDFLKSYHKFITRNASTTIYSKFIAGDIGKRNMIFADGKSWYLYHSKYGKSTNPAVVIKDYVYKHIARATSLMQFGAFEGISGFGNKYIAEGFRRDAMSKSNETKIKNMIVNTDYFQKTSSNLDKAIINLEGSLSTMQLFGSNLMELVGSKATMALQLSATRGFKDYVLQSMTFMTKLSRSERADLGLIMNMSIRYNPDANEGNFANKLSNLMKVATGLNNFQDANRLQMINVFAKDLYNLKDKSWEEFPDGFKKIFGSKRVWDYIRQDKFITELPNGSKILHPFNALMIDGQNASDTAISVEAAQAFNRVVQFSTVLTGDALSRDFLKRTRSMDGTYTSALNFIMFGGIMKFTGIALQTYRAVYPGIVKLFLDKGFGALAAFLAYSLMSAAIIVIIRRMSKGKDVELDSSFWTEVIVKSGMVDYSGEMLINSTMGVISNRNYQNFTSSTGKLIYDASKLAIDASKLPFDDSLSGQARGKSKVARDVVRLSKDITPKNVPLISWYLDKRLPEKFIETFDPYANEFLKERNRR